MLWLKGKKSKFSKCQDEKIKFLAKVSGIISVHIYITIVFEEKTFWHPPTPFCPVLRKMPKVGKAKAGKMRYEKIVSSNGFERARQFAKEFLLLFDLASSLC